MPGWIKMQLSNISQYKPEHFLSAFQAENIRFIFSFYILSWGICLFCFNWRTNCHGSETDTIWCAMVLTFYPWQSFPVFIHCNTRGPSWTMSTRSLLHPLAMFRGCSSPYWNLMACSAMGSVPHIFYTHTWPSHSTVYASTSTNFSYSANFGFIRFLRFGGMSG